MTFHSGTASSDGELTPCLCLFALKGQSSSIDKSPLMILPCPGPCLLTVVAHFEGQ